MKYSAVGIVADVQWSSIRDANNFLKYMGPGESDFPPKSDFNAVDHDGGESLNDYRITGDCLPSLLGI